MRAHHYVWKVQTEPEAEKQKPEKATRVYDALRPTAILLLMVGLMPMSSAKKCRGSSQHLHFSWISFSTIYSLAIGWSLVIQTSFYLRDYAQRIATSNDLKVAVYRFGGNLYWMSSTLTLFVCLNLSRKLPRVLQAWDEAATSVARYVPSERSSHRDGQQHHHLKRSVAIFITIGFTFLGLTEDLLHDVSLVKAYPCFNVEQYLKCHLQYVMTPTATFLGQGVFVQIFAFLVGVYVQFAWTFRDSIVVLFSMALQKNFAVLADHLKRTIGMPRAAAHWQRLRVDHFNLCKVAESIDQVLSPIVLISYAVNFHNLCFAIYGCIKIRKRPGMEVAFTITYIFLRIFAVTYSAGKFAATAKKTIEYLHRCPSAYYCTETEHFMKQLIGSDVQITGYKLFAVNYNLFLVMISSVITYEVIWFNASC